MDIRDIPAEGGAEMGTAPPRTCVEVGTIRDRTVQFEQTLGRYFKQRELTPAVITQMQTQMQNTNWRFFYDEVGYLHNQMRMETAHDTYY